MWTVTVQNGYELKKKIVYMNLLNVNATSHFKFLDVPVDFMFLTFYVNNSYIIQVKNITNIYSFSSLF